MVIKLKYKFVESELTTVLMLAVSHTMLKVNVTRFETTTVMFNEKPFLHFFLRFSLMNTCEYFSIRCRF